MGIPAKASSPVISIVGAGAVGGYYGARLAQHGFDVHFLMRSDYDHVVKHGLKIKSCDGDFSLPADQVSVYNDSKKMPKSDWVVITLKTTSNHLIESLVSPLVKDNSTILTLQNGLGNEELLAGLFGADRVMGGMAFTCIQREGPGMIHHSDHGLIRLGEFVGGPSDRAHAICQMLLDSRVKCEILNDLRYGRWLKLLWNIPFNGLGTALDQTTDRLIRTPDGEQLVREIIREITEVARAVDIHFDPTLEQVQITHTRSMGPYRTSMQIDRQLKRALEVEAILGRPLEVARKVGVATPRLDLLYRFVKLVDPAGVTDYC